LEKEQPNQDFGAPLIPKNGKWSAGPIITRRSYMQPCRSISCHNRVTYQPRRLSNPLFKFDKTSLWKDDYPTIHAKSSVISSRLRIRLKFLYGSDLCKSVPFQDGRLHIPQISPESRPITGLA
jgi:hypothetical protein